MISPAVCRRFRSTRGLCSSVPEPSGLCEKPVVSRLGPRCSRLSPSVRLSANSQTTRRTLISYCAHLRQRNGTRAHTQLKNTAPLSQSAYALAARARAMRYTPASCYGTTPSITYRYPAGTHERTSPTKLAPARSTAVGRYHHHHFCLTTTHDHQARASDEPPTKHAHEAQVIVTKLKRIGLSAFRRFSPTCVGWKKPA